MRRATLVGVLLTVSVGSVSVRAQDVPPNQIPPVVWPGDSIVEGEAGPSFVSRLATGAGGALLGAGLGFFASQLAIGDWDDGGSAQTINRGLWAAIGGGVGLTFGLSFPIAGRGAVSRGGMPRGRFHIPLSELEGRGLTNAYEAVVLLRPEWLQIRGNRSLAASIDPVVVEGAGSQPQVRGTTPLISEAGTIQVYIDDVGAGGLETLRSINIVNVRDIYFLNAAQATARWGGSNPHGAILIVG